MDTTPLFPLEQYEAGFPDLPQAGNDDTDGALQERDQTDETPDTEELRQATELASPTVFGQEDVPAQERIDHRAGIGEEHEPDRTEIAAPNPQGSSGLAGDSADNGELVSAEETSSIYEATGLTGPFKLNPMGMAFPDTSNEDLMALAANVEAIGILEEPTVAWTQGTENPPEVIDGKRIIQAAEIAGVQPTYRLLHRDIDPRDYVWAKNGERRNLSPSQKALAFALLYPKLGPGRPPGPAKNCQIFDSFPQPTQGQGAKKLKVSRPLINDAYKVADPNSWVAPEVREAVRDGIVTVSDAVRDTVSNVSQDVQREALSLVKDGSSRTLSAAVAKVERERHHEPLIIKLDRPTRLGKNLVLHSCSIDRLKWGLKPGTVDLVLAHLPEYFRPGFFYKIAELADHVLSDAGVLVVVWDGGLLREMLDRLSRGAPGMKFIADFSAIFPAPITELGFPHHTKIRRAALLVFGKQGAKLPEGDDVIEVPAPAGGMADDFMDLKDCLPLVVAKFASRGQTLCIPILTDNCGAVVAALAAGCTVIGADDEQSVIDDVVRRVSEPTHDSSPDDPESE